MINRFIAHACRYAKLPRCFIWASVAFCFAGFILFFSQTGLSPVFSRSPDVTEEVILLDPDKVSPDLLEPVSLEELEELQRVWKQKHESYHQPPLDPAETATGETILRSSLQKRSRGKPVKRVLALFQWNGREKDAHGVGKVALSPGLLRVEIGSLVYVRTGSGKVFFDRETNQGCRIVKDRAVSTAWKIENYFQFLSHLIEKQAGFDDIYSDYRSNRYIVKSLPPDDSPVYGVFQVSYPASRLESLEVIERSTASSILRMKFLSWNVNLSLPDGLFRIPEGRLEWDDLPPERIPLFLR